MQLHPAAEVRVVLDAIRRIVRLLRESTRRSERTLGASSAQLFVLQALASGEPRTVNQLAAKTLTHQSSVSAVVTKLGERGLIAKRRSKSDARSVSLTLTKKGRALLERAPETAQERLVAGILALAPKERQKLASGLAALVDRMNLGEGVPSMFFEE
jgi:DNA-binding MarR family transcriptional regulator